MRFATRLAVRPASIGRLPAVTPSGVRGINSYANFKIPTVNNEPNVCRSPERFCGIVDANECAFV
jgi:hypothetical protein